MRPVLHAIVSPVARRVLKRDMPIEGFLSFTSALQFQALNLVPRFLLALATVAVAKGLIDVSAADAALIGAAYVVAGAIGVLALFVPSGLGVRESTFVLLVVPVIPVEQAVIIALAARLVSTIADIALAAGYAALRITWARDKTRSAQPSTPPAG